VATQMQLSRAELAAAWQRSKLPDLPAVLAWPPLPSGTAVKEADSGLRERGMLDHRGVRHDFLSAALTLAVTARVQIDVRMAITTEERVEQTRACVVVRRDFAVVFRTVDDAVSVTWTHPDHAVSGLLAALPAAQPPSGTPVCVPTRSLQAAATATAGGTSVADLQQQLRRHRLAADQVRQIGALLGGRRVGNGVLELCVRDDLRRRAYSGRSVQLVDLLPERLGAPLRRALLYQRGDGHTVIAPAGHDRVSEAVAGLIRDARSRFR
jgi:GAF domain-containing protein